MRLLSDVPNNFIYECLAIILYSMQVSLVSIKFGEMALHWYLWTLNLVIWSLITIGMRALSSIGEFLINFGNLLLYWIRQIAKLKILPKFPAIRCYSIIFQSVCAYMGPEASLPGKAVQVCWLLRWNLLLLWEGEEGRVIFADQRGW